MIGAACARLVFAIATSSEVLDDVPPDTLVAMIMERVPPSFVTGTRTGAAAGRLKRSVAENDR